MLYRAHVKNGAIVLDEQTALPEGAELRVTLVQKPVAPTSEGEPKTLYERLKPIIGSIDDLPPDMSINLDHYLYGLPKRQP